MNAKASRRTCSSRGSYLRFNLPGPWRRAFADVNSQAKPSASEVTKNRRILGVESLLDVWGGIEFGVDESI